MGSAFKRYCLILFVLVLTSACTKKRESTFVQGQGADLTALSQYDNKNFSIDTLDKVSGSSALLPASKNMNAPAGASSKDIKISQVQIDAAAANMQVLPYVEFKSDSNLVKDLAMKGKTFHHYVGLYKITNNYLKVYKIGTAQDLDKDEMTYAEAQDDGTYAVPLIGYPIKGFYRIENVKNDNNENTSKLTEISLNSMEGATHLRIDFNAGQVFESANKSNVFVAKYFIGEWYYSKVIIAADANNAVEIGSGGVYDQNLDSTDRIKFVESENLLKAVNVNVAEKINKEEDVNLPLAMSLPIEWKDYKTQSKGKDKDLVEKEDEDGPWDKRPYIKLDFLNVLSFTGNDEDTPANTIVNKAISAGQKLTDLTVTSDYFSFTLQQEGAQNRVKYAFLRAKKSNYKPKVYFESDSKKFGYFTSQKSIKNNYEIAHKDQVEQSVFISRFNPEVKNIVFHFTKTSPVWLRPAAAQAVAGWDLVFQNAGTGIRVMVDTSFDVDLGDLRYNAINLIDVPVGDALYGYGPTVKDSITGEIISATANIHISSMRETFFDEIRNYVRLNLGLINDKNIAGLSSLAGNQNLTSPQVAARLARLKEIPKKHKYAVAQKIGPIKRQRKNFGREFDLAVSSKQIHKDIQTSCPEVMAYIKDLKSHGETHNSHETQILDQCSKKLVPSELISVLMHEMGHNFGLRHNFMGSTDKPNFIVSDKNQILTETSSVMDYLVVNDEFRITAPGPYDLAAIRYGYANQVENSSRQLVTLSSQNSIDDQLSKLNTRSYSYQYCTDEDLDTGLNPLCNQFDRGTTPLEIVTNMINDYQTSYSLLNYRYDSYKSRTAENVTAYKASMYLDPMFRIYEYWRVQFMQYAGKNAAYLKNMDEASYNQQLKNMSVDKKYGYFYSLYKPAVDKIYNFLKTVAFMPNHYCATIDAANELHLHEFENMRQDLYYGQNQMATRCTDQGMTQEFDEKKEKLVGEFGYELFDVKFDLDSKKTDEPLDIIGTFYDRLLAVNYLTSRELGSDDIQNRNFYPNFMDEPTYRKDFSQALQSRIVNGLDVSTLKEYMPKDLQVANKVVEKYKAEKFLLNDQMVNFENGLLVTDDIEESNRRLLNYAGVLTVLHDITDYDSQKNVFHFDPNRVYMTLSENIEFSNQMIAQANSILAMRNSPCSTNDFDDILNKVAEQSPNPAAFAKMTVNQFLDDMDDIDDLIKGLKNESQQVAIKNVLSFERILKDKLNDDISDSSAGDKKALLSEKISDYYPADEKQEGFFDKPDLQARIESQIQRRTNLRKIYASDPGEWDAQMNLLQSLMSMDEPDSN